MWLVYCSSGSAMSEWNVVDDLIHVGFRRQHEKKSEKYPRQLLNSLKSVALRGCTGAVVTGTVEEKKKWKCI